jgi:hypothetical protein
MTVGSGSRFVQRSASFIALFIAASAALDLLSFASGVSRSTVAPQLPQIVFGWCCEYPRVRVTSELHPGQLSENCSHSIAIESGI